MSLVDAIAPRARGKARTEMSPVAAVLASPLPKGLESANAAVSEAMNAVNVAYEMLSEARSSETKTALDEALRRAEAELSRAVVRREAAMRIGDDDAPSEEEIEGLHAKARAAKEAQAAHEPRIAAFAEELERRREKLNSALEARRATVQPFEDRLMEAIDEQLAYAANLVGEALAASIIPDDREELQEAPRFEQMRGDGYHRGVTTVAAPAILRETYRLARVGQHVAALHRGPAFG